MKKKLWLIALMLVLFACSNKTKSPFIEDEAGHKMYKNEDGIYVKNDWYEINGDKYYFDMNGYMKTDCAIDGRYVGEDGKMKKNYWIERDNKIYYLGEDGMYKRDEQCEIDGKTYSFGEDGSLFRDTIIRDSKTGEVTVIDEKGAFVTEPGIYEKGGDEYYIKKDGKVAHEEWITIDGKDIYFGINGESIKDDFAIAKDFVKSTESEITKWCYIDKDGNIVKNDWISYESDWCYADENGVLLQNEWKTIDGIEYYFNKDCYMVKNDFVDGIYYVDSDGKKLTNTERVINGTNYKFDNEGKSNVKVNPKTKNLNWQLEKISNSNKYYVMSARYYDVSYGIGESTGDKLIPISVWHYRAGIAVSEEKVLIGIESDVLGIKKEYDDLTITIISNGVVCDISKPLKVADGCIYLIQKQTNVLKNILNVDGNSITIKIEELSDENNRRVYEFSFTSTGFSEIYKNLY